MRKSTSATEPEDWDRLIDGINRLHGTGAALPAYRNFVKGYVRAMTTAEGMTWRVRTMTDMGMIGVNLPAWHRQMLVRFERRLQRVYPSVFIPYWDWIAHPNPPARSSDPALLDSWSVERDPNPNFMPLEADVEAVKASRRFVPFKSALENGPHNAVHNAIGGDVTTAASPTDPLCFMHHANVDRLWYQWQEAHPNRNASNMDEVLKSASLSDVSGSSVVDRSTLLPYSYA